METGVYVAEMIAVRNDKVQEGVREIIGGRILEYEAKTIYWEGVRWGVYQVLVHSIESIMKNMSMSLDETCRAVGSSIEEYQSAKEFLARQEKTYSGGAG